MNRLFIILACMCLSLGVNAKECLAELPAMKYSLKPAIINGVLKGYTLDSYNKVAFYYTPFDGSAMDSVVVNINNDGTFKAEMNIYYTSRVSIRLKNASRYIVLNPDEEITISVDMKRYGEAYPKKPVFTFTGELSDFNADLVQYGDEYMSTKILAPIQGDEGIKTLKGITLNQYRDRVIELYNDGLSKMQKDKRLCGAFKQYVKTTYQFQTMTKVMMYSTTLQIANGEKVTETRPDDYYNFLKEWNLFADNAILYALPLNQVVSFPRSYGAFTIGAEFETPKSFVEFRQATTYAQKVDDNIVLGDDAIKDLKETCPTLYPLVLKKNDALVAKLEEAKKNPQYKVKSISEDLKGEDIFRAIIADYKGKPLLVDFWATWCGPCKAAMKTILPVKEELKGKANFVYITGPSSPKELWQGMIIDIHGDHYYVTADQYSALLKQFESQGIPTYVIVDKDGNVVAKHVGYPGNDVIKEELMK